MLDRSLDADQLARVQAIAGNAAATALVQRQVFGPMGSSTVQAPADVNAEEATAQSSGSRTLRYGDTGEDVKQLQMRLRRVRERQHDREPSNDGEARHARIDGIFGPLTRQDVIDFQTDTGLDADGVVGPRTWNALTSLVPERLVEEAERGVDARMDEAVALFRDTRYDEAIAMLEPLLEEAPEPEMQASVLGRIGNCHQQRARFGLAVTAYERALAARFNQEMIRSLLLEDLMLARTNQFMPAPRAAPPRPEPIPLGGANPEAYAGGGVRQRQTARDGDSGSHVDLFKGKLTNLTIAWQPFMVGPEDYFEITTTGRTEVFQRACGLPATGEADAATWHALDSFMHADVPLSMIKPILDEMFVAYQLPDHKAAIAGMSASQDKAGALGLGEIVLQTEWPIGQRLHDLGDYEAALESYGSYLGRVFPPPHQLGMVMEDIRAARERRPRPRG